MVNLASALFGPLAGPECRRSVARGWLILVRGLSAAAVFGVVLLALWAWWISQRLDASHRPYYEVRLGLQVVEGMLLTIAMILGPALLAGSLTGEKERGALGLLLTTRVSAREIVAGRMAGKLSQVGMILLAGMPALVFMAALAGFDAATQLMLILLPTAVAAGGGGLAVVASTLSRRGRDALLSVYMVELLLMLAPLSVTLGIPGGLLEWVAALNPFTGLDQLIFREKTGPAWVSIGEWLAMGFAGIAYASWRLRPSCLCPADGERVPGTRTRRGFVPPVPDSRPMFWKELFIERVGTLGRFGRWIGLVLVLGLIVGSVGLTAVLAWDDYRPGQHAHAVWAKDQLAIWVGLTGGFLSCLIQWAVGLRAAVSISSERERGTWDALLTSPLDAREIVRGKLWGSLNALRWLVFSALLAWTLAAATFAIPARDAVRWSCEVLVIGAFMAAVGVRTSLSCQTATRAMSLTIGAWLGSYVLVRFAAGIVLAVGTLICNAAWIVASQIGLAAPVTTFWLPLPLYVAWPIAIDSLYFLATIVVVADTRLRFDRIAGRMTEGRAAVAFDELIYGRPEAPVPIGPDGQELPLDGRPDPVLDVATGSRREDAVAGPAGRG